MNSKEGGEDICIFNIVLIKESQLYFLHYVYLEHKIEWLRFSNKMLGVLSQSDSVHHVLQQSTFSAIASVILAD